MTEFHVLIWALSLLFCMAIGFVILLWCRSWRREEREVTARQLEALSNEVQRLALAVDGMDETAASLLAADELLANDTERLREQVRLFRTAQARTSTPEVKPGLVGAEPRSVSPPGDAPAAEAEDSGSDRVASADDADSDRFDQARRLLGDGVTPLEVARELQMGAAEVRMIARMMESEVDP